jgi:hypothetical protein
MLHPTSNSSGGRASGANPLVVCFGIALALIALFLVPLAFLQPKVPDIHAAAVFSTSATVDSLDPASLANRGRLYVPAYSSIPAGGGATKVDLTVTLSIRNVSQTAPLLVERVDYYDTTGALVRPFLQGAQTLAPLGTIEVIIADRDVQGGTGAKFLVDWAGPSGSPAPLVEAVMIGILGTQGFSFVSPGRPIPRSP